MSLSELSYKVGDTVWVGGWGSNPQQRRAVVQQVIDDGDNDINYLVEFGNGGRRWCYHSDLRPYDAVDQLADLIRCEKCGRPPADCYCPKFTITAASTDGTDGRVTVTCNSTTLASNSDPITQLGDLVRYDQRRPLSPHEKHRRRRRNWLAKRSRQRNRGQR